MDLSQRGSTMILIIIGVAVFVLAIAGFSLMLGVFSSSDQDSQDAEAAGEVLPADSSGHKGKDQFSEIDELEKQLMGMDGLSGARDLDDVAALAEKNALEISEEDSLAVVSWLDKEKARLSLERKEIESKLKLLEEKKKELDNQEYRMKQIVVKIEQVEAARVGALAKLYDDMKASQVAPLIMKLPEEKAVQVLLKMKPSNAAEILGAINPTRAASISARMITLTEES